MSGRSVLLAALLLAPELALGFGFGGSERQDGGAPGGFLAASANARSLAMGGAHTAVADDASAAFWNASGLAQVQRYDVVAHYSRLGDDAGIGAGAFAVPTRRWGTFGINVVGLRSGSFNKRDELNRDLGSFDNNAAAYMLSQARNIGTRWSAGYTVKAVRQEIERYSDTGYGLDLGVLARPHPLWQIGLALQNAIQPSLKLKDDAERLPTEARVGGRFEPRKELTFAADLSFQDRRSTELSLGAEWRVADPVALRLGANDREISAGVGVGAGDMGIDYAFGLPHASVVRTELGSSHRVSFHLRFGSDVMAGSYRDLVRRREEQQEEIAMEKKGGDRVGELKGRMRKWDGRMDAETFAQVRDARESLRELAFRDPVALLEAQAYIAHFQGKFDESARLFDRAVELNPKDRRLRRDAAIALERARAHPGPSRTSQIYDRMEAADRSRREQNARALALAASAESAEPVPETAGGAGSSRDAAVEERGETEPRQVAMLPPALPPPVQQPPPAIRRPAAPPAPAAPAARPEPRPSPTPVVPPRPTRPETPARPSPAAPPVRPTVPAPAATPVPAAPARPELVDARRRFDEGDYVGAHLATRRILEKNPSDRPAARQAMITNTVVAAEAAIVDPKETVDIPGIEKRVDHSLAVFDQGMRLYQRKKRDDAMLLWERAVEICPANFLARDMIGRVNQAMFDEKWDRLLNGSRGG